MSAAVGRAPLPDGMGGADPDRGDMVARLLFVGDIHLGRRPSRLPADLDFYALLPSDLTPEAAFRSLVDHAIAGGVDAVVLAGDVVDGLDDRFEAYAHLKAGVVRLIDAGVPLFAVAGNHDVEALPRLAAQIEGFRLIGEGGVWEALPFRSVGGETLCSLGWSI